MTSKIPILMHPILLSRLISGFISSFAAMSSHYVVEQKLAKSFLKILMKNLLHFNTLLYDIVKHKIMILHRLVIWMKPLSFSIWLEMLLLKQKETKLYI